jgi:hypothetical protein
MGNRLYYLRKEAGLCPYCGGERDRAGKTICSSCSARHVAGATARYNKRKEAGLCPDCGGPRDLEFTITCSACIDEHRAQRDKREGRLEPRPVSHRIGRSYVRRSNRTSPPASSKAKLPTFPADRVGIIYALTEPGESWNVRYIGRTHLDKGETVDEVILARVKAHMLEAGSSLARTRKLAWLRQLKDAAVRPDYFYIAAVPFSESGQAEREYALLCQIAGFDLVNSGYGGGVRRKQAEDPVFVVLQAVTRRFDLAG